MDISNCSIGGFEISQKEFEGQVTPGLALTGRSKPAQGRDIAGLGEQLSVCSRLHRLYPDNRGYSSIHRMTVQSVTARKDGT